MLSDVTTDEDKRTYFQEHLYPTWREALSSLRGKLDGLARATIEANMVPFGVDDQTLIFTFKKKNCFADPGTLVLVAEAYRQLFGFTGEILAVAEATVNQVKAQVPETNAPVVLPDPGERAQFPGPPPDGEREPEKPSNGVRPPAQIWEACQNQLGGELSQATFARWVAPAQFASFADGTFTIAVEDPTARDWLESRLVSTLNRTLSGMMAQAVTTRIVVRQAPAEEPAPDHPANDPSQAKPTLPLERKLWMKEKTDSLLELFFRPNRVIGLPGYLLRWLPYLGGTGMSVLTGLRQSFYRKYHHLAVANQEFEASAPEVAQLAGVAKSTFWRTIGSPSLRWFIERVPLKAGEEQWFLDPLTQTVKRHVNKFCFVNTIPLTPGDADRLAQALIAAGGATQPEAALQQLLASEPKEYLGPMHQAPPSDWTGRDPALSTVEAVVMAVSGLTAREIPPELRQLIEKLSLAILSPAGDVVLISQYFWNHWLPRLGHNPSWIVIAMRDRGFVSAATGELRERVYLREGYAELAALLGIQRVKTVREWLPIGGNQDERENRPEPSLSGEEEYQAWLRQVPMHSDPWIDATRKALGRFLRVSLDPKQSNALNLWVRVGSDPLIPEDDLAYQMLLRLTDRFVQLPLELQTSFLNSISSLGGNRTHVGKSTGGNETHSVEDGDGIGTHPFEEQGGKETHTPEDLDGIRTHLDTLLGGNRTYPVPLWAEIGRLISLGGLRFLNSKSLKRYFQHFQNQLPTTITGKKFTAGEPEEPDHPPSRNDGEVVVEENGSPWNIPAGWDADHLLGVMGPRKFANSCARAR